jgi:acetyl esterase/lipase
VISRALAPFYHADRLAKPVIFFQGDEDAVVPLNQAEAMVEALRRAGNPVGYFLFSGEHHGFWQADNLQRCLDAETLLLCCQRLRHPFDLLGQSSFHLVLPTHHSSPC